MVLLPVIVKLKIAGNETIYPPTKLYLFQHGKGEEEARTY